MPKYLIEREIPGAGKLTSQELRAISEIKNVIDPTTAEKR